MVFAYCPCCMYRTEIGKGKPEDYTCPRHGLKLYAGEVLDLNTRKKLYGDVFACEFLQK